MDENDYEGWKILTQKIGPKCNSVGEDLLVTTKPILQEGINNIVVTINDHPLEDNTVTVRERNTGTQTRVHIDEL